MNLQDITEHALLKGLIRNDADYGCVILMDVETGDIKSISNLSKNENGNYVFGKIINMKSKRSQ